MINLGTSGPGIRILRGGDLLFWICLKAKVTLTMNRAILLIKTAMTAICARTPALLMPRILGFERILKSSLAVELVRSEADRSFFRLLNLSVPRMISVMRRGNCFTDTCLVKP